MIDGGEQLGKVEGNHASFEFDTPSCVDDMSEEAASNPWWNCDKHPQTGWGGGLCIQLPQIAVCGREFSQSFCPKCSEEQSGEVTWGCHAMVSQALG
jgi:hypothetical protein